jgi:hypothetical protein
MTTERSAPSLAAEKAPRSAEGHPPSRWIRPSPTLPWGRLRVKRGAHGGEEINMIDLENCLSL